MIENDEEDEISIELNQALNENRDDNNQDEIIDQQERLVVVEDIQEQEADDFEYLSDGSEPPEVPLEGENRLADCDSRSPIEKISLKSLSKCR